MKKKFLTIFVLCMILIGVLVGCGLPSVGKKQLSTVNDSRLRTLILSDVRFDGSAADVVREKMISTMVERREPEFIAITGNLVNCRNNGEVMKKAAAFIDSFGIPWAMSLGELDVKGNTSPNKIMRILMDQSLQNSMVMRGDSYKNNYILEVVDGSTGSNKVINLLYFVDTTEECTDKFVEWYKNTITELSYKYNEVQGRIMQSHVFMNRPLPAFADNTSAISSKGYEVHPWANSTIFQDAIYKSDSTKTVFAGFDEGTDGSYHDGARTKFVYVRTMMFDSSMTGEKYDKQKKQTGYSSCEFGTSSSINLSQTYRYSPDDYLKE